VSQLTCHVAIVDDEESFRVALVRLFRQASFSAEAFDCGSSLLDSLPIRVPDCVIVDLQMPGMTGIELIERLSRLAAPPPVIVVTAAAEQDTREDCMALGTKRYLRKPVDCAILLDSVRQVLAPPLA
jgi:FixJ family two-component response regulator